MLRVKQDTTINIHKSVFFPSNNNKMVSKKLESKPIHSCHKQKQHQHKPQ